MIVLIVMPKLLGLTAFVLADLPVLYQDAGQVDQVEVQGTQEEEEEDEGT